MQLTHIQELWLQRLETGTHQRTAGKLASTTENAFCCLGVACEIHFENQTAMELKALDKIAGKYGFVYNGKGGSLPDVVTSSLNLRSNYGHLHMQPGTFPTNKVGMRLVSLAEMNDSDCFTHPELAAFIRANPEAVFTYV